MWPLWHQGCGQNPFSPLSALSARPSPCQPCWGHVLVLRHRCLLGGGLHAGGVVAPPVQGEALLQLFSWLFKHTVLPGRNCGRQRPPRRCLGREQVPCASAGILQGNRRGFKGFAGCRWFPCSIFLLPSLREAALSTLCGWEGCGGEDALSGAWLYTECCWWGRAQQAHAAQVSSSDVLLRSRALLCGFLCLLFPSAWASRQRLDCHLCK